MIRIETERDPEVLRQVALLLDRENRKLHDRVAHLTRELSQLRGDDALRLQLELDALKDLLARRERALFAVSSERRPHNQPPTETAPAEPRRGHGPRPQPELPVIEKLYELPEDRRSCTSCGGVLTEWKNQCEESEEITVVERSFTLVKQKRKKYRCACNANVTTAPGPLKLKAGSRYAVEFAVEVAIAKYQDHLPLNRQVRQMRREGLVVDTQTLWDQIEALASPLQPSHHALKDRVLGSGLVHADETGWRFLGKNSTKRWWVWSVASDDAVYYRIAPSRSAEAAAHLLNGYRGIVMADGYSAYAALARGQPGFRLTHCWAHVRRKFVEIEDNYPVECSRIVGLIGKLYATEHLVPAVRRDTPAQERTEALQLRARLRDERSRAAVAEIRAWAFEQHPLPESGLGKAIAYMMSMWKGLTAFLEDPIIPLDNNAAERALRDVVLGRKNHYGSHSQRGTEVAALFYSLVESAELCGVEPKAYLLKAALAAIEKPGTVTLPHDLAG